MFAPLCGESKLIHVLTWLIPHVAGSLSISARAIRVTRPTAHAGADDCELVGGVVAVGVDVRDGLSGKGGILEDIAHRVRVVEHDQVTAV